MDPLTITELRSNVGTPSLGTRPPTHPEDAVLVEGLRAGSEASFTALIDRYQGSMLRVAGFYVAGRGAAEDVVQETWLAVMKGVARFDGRSSIKTWIFRILTNWAKTMGQRTSRMIPFSALIDGAGGDEPAVDPSRFIEAGHPQWPGHWCSPPSVWTGADDHMVTTEAVEVVMVAISSLTRAQQAVITLRDVECWTATEVCDLLGLSEGNQRVLLTGPVRRFAGTSCSTSRNTRSKQLAR